MKGEILKPPDSSIRVQIFGSEYQIATEIDSEHTRQVARYVDSKMREIANALALRSVAQIAVLTAVNLADELLKEIEAGRKMEQTAGEKAEQLADSIKGLS